jgi:hypothetical protein
MPKTLNETLGPIERVDSTSQDRQPQPLGPQMDGGQNAAMADAVNTPVPWDYFVGDANGRGLIRIEAGNASEDAGHHIASMPRGAVSEANAALIVKAVNSHEALVRALQKIVEMDDKPVPGAYARIALKALAQAEAQP